MESYPSAIIRPRYAVLQSNFTVTNTTTLADVTDFGFNIGASSTEIWFFQVTAEFTAPNATGDLKVSLTGPSGAAPRWGPTDLGGGSFPGYGAWTTGNSSQNMIGSFGGTDSSGGANVTWGKRWVGKIIGGGTAGFVQFQMAQNTQDNNDLTMLAGSVIEYVKLKG